MKKILVAGAGHGGLAAAIKLAAAGADVTVFEKNAEEKLGHDWEDRFTFSLLEEITGTPLKDWPEGSWRYRGDCAFVSPAKRKKIVINYTDETRQKIMKRQPLAAMLVAAAKKNGVKFMFETEVTGPLTENGAVTGLSTSAGNFPGDLVIDAAGAFSPVRTRLPESAGIEKTPRHGDLFYAYRAYFDKKTGFDEPDVPFEIYMYHEGERGLSWLCTNENSVDILIGRTDKLTKEKVEEQLSIFRKDHPWTGDTTVSGGQFGVIPVRRPLTLMVADGYAATGDAAFMTFPMNGMGIDLSLQSGLVLAETVINAGDKKLSAETLWDYNRRVLVNYCGDAAKNEGLKNAILSIPSVGVDFLFENGIIQSSDLAGGGRNTNIGALLGKLVHGMKKPGFFFAIIKGLIKGGKNSKLYKNPPEKFDRAAITAWSDKIAKNDISIPQ